ncbi:MAG TPA: dihydroorotate dehydrogenase [Acidisarcina sp.]|nr:dihydroorotate dehydrogenase [Acidisarcina sp.]
MRVQLAGITLTSPVVAASGTFGYGIEFEDIVDLDRLGGLVTKGLSREPMAGNQAPRIVQTASGMMNAIGLQNIGVEAFLEKKLPLLRRYPTCAVFVNVFGYTVADYIQVIDRLNQVDGIAAYELNVSCPNVHEGGMVFGSDPRLLDDLVTRAKNRANRPLIVKLSPNVTSIAEMARCAANSGADALSLVNTFLSLAIDPETRRPRIANVTAGLSGPAIKPIALRMVYEASRAVSIPILGMGGITTPEDAVEFLLAGATAVQVGTASYADPRAVERISHGLEHWCRSHNVKVVSELTGGLLLD